MIKKHSEKPINMKKKFNHWVALIGVNSKQKYLGYFKTKEAAVRARLEAEAKYYT